jgi:hypothetical protein
MKKVMAVAVTLLISGTLTSAQAQESKWVCKTGPVWNGRTRYPAIVEGRTRDEAYSRAVATCNHGGQAEYCKSVITCWAE